MPAALLSLLALSHFALFALPKESVELFILLVISQCLLWIPIYLGKQRVSPWFASATFLIAFVLARLRLPHYENDFYRYFWDGLHVEAGRSPYQFPPGTSPLEGFEEIRSRVAFSTLPSFYPPAAQALFGALVFCSRYSVDAFLWLLAAGGAIVAGFAMARLYGREKITDVFLVLQHPLLVLEWYGAAHYDSWVTAALVLGMATSSAAWLGLAANLKLPTGISIFTLKARPRDVFLFAAAFLVPWLLFWNHLDQPLGTYFRFGTTWEMNSGVFRWLRAMGLAPSLARVMVLGIWGAVCVKLYRATLSDFEKLFWALFSMVALSPVANTWYFTWALPFAVFLPRRRQVAAFLAFAVTPLSYAFFIPEPWVGYERWWDVEYGVLGLLAFLCYRHAVAAPWPVSRSVV